MKLKAYASKRIQFEKEYLSEFDTEEPIKPKKSKKTR